MTGSNISHINKTQRATDPYANIAVFASAGSGKTYLLVHRILKLLLNGIEPAQILAITFTRKAAAEMQERLMKVLAEWASVDDSQLQKTLKDLSHSYDNVSISKARNLYEELLFAEHEIRITTFHAFCQDILKRFAIHAGVPAGFRVVETTFELKEEARKRLFKKAQSKDHIKLSQALFKLLQHSSSVNNVNQLLDTFIDSRSDWWSFTELQTDPVTFAGKCLHKKLFKKTFNLSDFLNSLRPFVEKYSVYLSQHPTDTNLRHCKNLTIFLQSTQLEEQHLDAIVNVYLTNEIKKRKLKTSKALEKNLGNEKMNKLLELHDIICEKLFDYLDNKKKQALYEFNRAWFFAGYTLVQEYQELKFQQHILDFDDLEWYTYLLLNQHENAAWVQYKLDQRIQHILIDEFQDTNPTQWKLISPLLNELAIDSSENHRSLFFVGDAKQSIYGFRRANSELQFNAANWAKQNLKADVLETDESFRSSPAIVNFVNQVFSQENILLNNFNTHQAVQSDLWGEVHVDSLITVDDLDEKAIQHKAFRNPLTEPKQNVEYDCHYLEGQSVANKINTIICNSTTINEQFGTRAINFSDIMILARNRTHLAQLELALREQNIPYNSTYEKDFLSALEVQDILALLTFLIQPHNDLALAQVLRSPLYAFSDEELMQISIQKQNTWHEKLIEYADTSANPKAKSALEQINNWQLMTNTLPVHDLLDQIYFQTNLLSRYASCCTKKDNSKSKTQVLDNLISLLQLSLDIDAGRYSSVQSFLNALRKPNAGVSLSRNLQQQNENVVQIMTIHAAKGLEAPVVFLYDTGPQKNKPFTYQPIIQWPSDALQPELFFILGRKNEIDTDTQSIINKQTDKERLEELNLLYVALTRAKQYLFISGTASQHHSISWHSIINDAFEQDINSNPLCMKFGTAPKPESQKVETEKNEQYQNHTYNLSQAFINPNNNDTNTTQAVKNDTKADYGTLVHKIFELTEPHFFQEESDYENLRITVESELGSIESHSNFERALNEVKNCYQSKELEEIFSTSDEKEILKEIPISFTESNKVYFRIIDQIIIDKMSAWIIDYKTSSEATLASMHELAKQYRPQMSVYKNAVKKLYPNKTIRTSVLFTSIPAIYDYSDDELNG